jgi:integrase
MSAITTAHVETFKAARLDQGASNGEINRELALLKRMFTLAVRGGRLLARPHIPMLTAHNVRTGFFEREPFEAVRAHLPAPLRPVVTFAYLTGWRVPSEGLTLEWRQVDLPAGFVTLDAGGTTKNGEARVFPFAAPGRSAGSADRAADGHRRRAEGVGRDRVVRVSPAGEADPVVPQGVGRGLRGGGMSRPDPA